MDIETLTEVTPVFILRALDRRGSAATTLARLVLRVVELEVQMNLRNKPAARERGLAAELVQDAVEYLYWDGGKRLRHWDPERASLKTYIRVITRRLLHRKLVRQFRGNPNALTPVEPSHFELSLFDPEGKLEDEILYRLELERIWDYVEAHGTSCDRERFHALFVELVDNETLAARDGVKVEAIHTWLSRFRGKLGEAMPETMERLRERRNARRRGAN